MKVKSESEVAQLCPTPIDAMDHSPPGSSVHGIFQARVLEWGAIDFSTSPHVCKSILYVSFSIAALILHNSRDSTEKTMATHSSSLAWKIPWTEEPGRLQSVGSLRVGHD